jgi:YtxH-like protein
MINPFSMSSDDILARLGLESRRSASSSLMLPLAMLGVGILTGAGLGLLFAPRAGRETREQLGSRATEVAGKIRSKVRRAGEEISETVDDARDAIVGGIESATDHGAGGNGMRGRMSHS